MNIYTDGFKPTYLYIKQHTITGKLYFGKTNGTEQYLLEQYNGGGEYWRKHIKKYGTEHVITLWYCLFTEKDELVKFALMCSEQWNIVKSKKWANKQFENGLDGGGLGNGGANKGKKFGPKSTKSRNQISISKTGIKYGPQPKLTCPHCNTIGGLCNMKRYHFDNCRIKQAG